MTVFSSPEFDDHEEVLFHFDPETNLRAIVAIHDTTLGAALGGCRMWPYPSDDAALTDALRLSRGMTYKAAAAGMARGGGKSVIIGDPRTDKTPELLRAFGRFVHSLNGRYHTGEDVGMTVADLDIVRQETPFAHGHAAGTGDPSLATAYGVFTGIRAAAKHKFGYPDLSGRRVAVQGLGNVGFSLCQRLAAVGARLFVADLDAERVQHAVDRLGATAVTANSIHAADVDIFAPCAMGAIVNDKTIGEIRATIVAGSANNQLETPAHGTVLAERGILYAPDYIINAGGLIDIANEGDAYEEAKVWRQLDEIFDRLIAIFERAERENLSTEMVADRVAMERILASKQPHPIAA